MSGQNVKNSRILITGGAGFIGSSLCESFLKCGNQVICLDNFSTGKRKNIEEFLSQKNFELIEGDIRNIQDCRRAMRGVDYVLHQAALGSVPRSIEDPITSNEVNVTGFLNVLNSARESKVKRFVYASSSSVYGDHPILPKKENELGRPLSPYAVNKKANEYYAEVFSRLYGMETIGLRYFNVFGRRQDPEGAYAAAIPKFIKSLIAGQSPVFYGDGSQSRDFTYVENVVQINHLALLSTRPDSLNTFYNVAYGEQYTLNQLFDILVSLLAEYKPDVKQIKPKLDRERPGDIKHSLAAIEKAKTLLGYKPEYDLRRGMTVSIKWYWENLGGR